MREDKHHLGRVYRKANPLERYVAAILDTNAHARQEPCVFYYLADGPDGRPRMCGNPHFSRCIHQMLCRECEAFIDSELAEVIEKREGALLISVPVPLAPKMVEELSERDRLDPLAVVGATASSFLWLGRRPVLGSCGIPEGSQARIDLFPQQQGIGPLIESLQPLPLLWTENSCGQ